MKRLILCMLVLGAMVSPVEASVLWQADSATVVATPISGGWVFEVTSSGTIIATCNNEQLSTGTCEDALEGLHDITGRMPAPDEDVIDPNVAVVEQVLPAGTLSGPSDQDPPSDSDPPVDQGLPADHDGEISTLGAGNSNCIPAVIEYPTANQFMSCLLEVPGQGDLINLAGVGQVVVSAPPIWTISTTGIDSVLILTNAAE